MSGYRDEAVTGKRIVLRVDGVEIPSFDGEALAVSLLKAGIRHLRDAPVSGLPRGAFCFMGSCQECLVEIDGRRALACQEKSRAGMDVRLGLQ
jgi:predicted molibdopterin-dependent oxidoreductase YjgC